MPKRKYIVPILKPEHCTKEYMDAVGLPRRIFAATRWARTCFDSADVDQVRGRFASSLFAVGWCSARTAEAEASCFNAAVLAIDPHAKPTGKPYPLPKRGKVK